MVWQILGNSRERENMRKLTKRQRALLRKYFDLLRNSAPDNIVYKQYLTCVEADIFEPVEYL